ncbi:isochorismatase family protein [Heliorestis acidaminivorans]|uniref:Isochorismatase family protein n=1 Tax=Heliorestis acidaminivorans TaxID=553427 RepID=A0A6I0EYX9_9FIRM|nr:isochorismatase family protein [Heliorestis acidaminivorans]KAB2951806.1 isochorismatase family protein [Heliorestis acidaminivorans]
MAYNRLKREEVLLLVIDVQERLVPAIDKKEVILRNIAILAQTAHKLAIPILITEQYPKGLGTTVQELQEVLAEAKVLEKVTFSACNEELLTELEQVKRKDVIVVGTECHVCVFQTVRDLLNQGYRVILPSDAIGSRRELNYQNGLAMMKELGAEIWNSESVFFDLLERACTDEFRALAPLVK